MRQSDPDVRVVIFSAQLKLEVAIAPTLKSHLKSHIKINKNYFLRIQLLVLGYCYRQNDTEANIDLNTLTITSCLFAIKKSILGSKLNGSIFARFL